MCRSAGGNGGLSAGPATIWLCAISEGFNIDYFGMFSDQELEYPTPSPTMSPSTISRDETPAPVVLGDAFGGVPAVVPGVIEAEEFDTGGEGVGYSDADPGNNGGVSVFNGYVFVRPAVLSVGQYLGQGYE